MGVMAVCRPPSCFVVLVVLWKVKSNMVVVE